MPKQKKTPDMDKCINVHTSGNKTSIKYTINTASDKSSVLDNLSKTIGSMPRCKDRTRLKYLAAIMNTSNAFWNVNSVIWAIVKGEYDYIEFGLEDGSVVRNIRLPVLPIGQNHITKYGNFRTEKAKESVPKEFQKYLKTNPADAVKSISLQLPVENVSIKVQNDPETVIAAMCTSFLMRVQQAIVEMAFQPECTTYNPEGIKDAEKYNPQKYIDDVKAKIDPNHVDGDREGFGICRELKDTSDIVGITAKSKVFTKNLKDLPFDADPSVKAEMIAKMQDLHFNPAGALITDNTGAEIPEAELANVFAQRAAITIALKPLLSFMGSKVTIPVTLSGAVIFRKTEQQVKDTIKCIQVDDSEDEDDDVVDIEKRKEPPTSEEMVQGPPKKMK